MIVCRDVDQCNFNIPNPHSYVYSIEFVKFWSRLSITLVVLYSFGREFSLSIKFHAILFMTSIPMFHLTILEAVFVEFAFWIAIKVCSNLLALDTLISAICFKLTSSTCSVRITQVSCFLKQFVGARKRVSSRHVYWLSILHLHKLHDLRSSIVACSWVPLLCWKEISLQCFFVVNCNTYSKVIEISESTLKSIKAHFCCSSIQSHCFPLILFHSISVLIQTSEVLISLRHMFVQLLCLCYILVHASLSILK